MQSFKTKNLSALSHIEHGFFTKNGGVSMGIYKSLNCSINSHDDILNIAANQALVKQHFRADKILTLNQIHSDKVITVKDPWKFPEIPKGDAIVCSQPSIVIGINTADCVPILLAHKSKRLIAAIHAGWKGALSDIIENTLKEMQAKPSDIVAAIGPAIAQDSYEVDADFKKKFQNSNELFKSSPNRGKAYFDLPGFIEKSLHKIDITNVENLNLDTYSDPRFFSARRAAKDQQEDFGRQISAIVIKG